MRFLLTATVLFFAQTACASETPEQFFARFVSLGQRFDPAVAELYEDHASVRMYRRYPHGLERSGEMTGVEWKALVRKVMPLAQAKDDRSTYTHVKVSSLSTGARVKIKADRHVVRKCYTDAGYYVVIERRANGDFGVVEEYFESEARPDCK